MASSDPTGLYIFGFIILLIIGVFLYARISKRRTDDQRRQMITAFRASPVIAKNAPVLVTGPAVAPDIALPTTGEHVAFYGTFVLSREAAISGTHSGIGLNVNGVRVSGSGEKITEVKGFRFFETSGDFTVQQGASAYRVDVPSVIAYFARGAAMVGFAGNQFKAMGLSEQAWNDTMNFKIAEQALLMLCGYEAPIGTQHAKRRSGGFTEHKTTDYTSSSVVTVKSRIDSRINYYNAGHNVPQGILQFIAKRGLSLEENEEIIVVETFIPLNKEVFVFGTFDGDRSIVYADGTVQLSVSYTDPAAV